MQEPQYKCEECKILEADIIALNNRVQTLEHSCARMREAFVSNDLGLPDYDGHRSAHKSMIDQAKVVDGYKADATKEFIKWVLVGVLGVFVLGLVDWLKGHLK